MSLQFIACSDTKCPLNTSKQCRSPFIFVDEEGRCSIRESGPYDNKSDVEKYVDLKQCDCSKCDHWEENSLGVGSCGFGGDLFFGNKNICYQFEKQIGDPGFSTTV